MVTLKSRIRAGRVSRRRRAMSSSFPRGVWLLLRRRRGGWGFIVGRGGRIPLELGGKTDGLGGRKIWRHGAWLWFGCGGEDVNFWLNEERCLRIAICVKALEVPNPLPVIIFLFHMQAQNDTIWFLSLIIPQKCYPTCLNHDINQQCRAFEALPVLSGLHHAHSLEQSGGGVTAWTHSTMDRILFSTLVSFQRRWWWGRQTDRWRIALTAACCGMQLECT